MCSCLFLGACLAQGPSIIEKYGAQEKEKDVNDQISSSFEFFSELWVYEIIHFLPALHV